MLWSHIEAWVTFGPNTKLSMSQETLARINYNQWPPFSDTKLKSPESYRRYREGKGLNLCSSKPNRTFLNETAMSLPENSTNALLMRHKKKISQSTLWFISIMQSVSGDVISMKKCWSWLNSHWHRERMSRSRLLLTDRASLSPILAKLLLFWGLVRKRTTSTLSLSPLLLASIKRFYRCWKKVGFLGTRNSSLMEWEVQWRNWSWRELSLKRSRALKKYIILNPRRKRMIRPRRFKQQSRRTFLVWRILD